MTSQTPWIAPAAVAVAGTLLVVGHGLDGRIPVSAGLGLLGLSIPLAVHAVVNRRRHTSHSDAPDSVESVVATNARAAAYIDTLVLGAVLLLLVTAVPAVPPGAWTFAYLALAVADFWVRYAVGLRHARG